MHTNSLLWKELVQASNTLQKPTFINALLTKKDISEIESLIKEIIHSFLDRGEYHIGLKTYVNQELNNEVVNRMVKYPPQLDLSIEDWCQQIFGDDKFGIVLNTLEGYSNAFSEKAAELVSPLLKEAGLPLEGLSFLFFMGNYGFTPFGIHKESRGEEGLLFHLGPGKKTFYTWDSPEYNAIEHYTESFKNINDMLPEAKAYVLNPGDVMFIPHQVFHIANSSEFSLSFVMDYINPPTDRFENQLLEAASKEALYLKKEYTSPIQSEFPFQIDRMGILEKIDIAYKRRILELKSNAGILRKSIVAKGKHLPNTDFTVKGKAVFPIFMDKHGKNQMVIFARGHRFVKPFNSNFKKSIENLNQGISFTLGNLVTELQPEWDMVDIFSFVSDLFQIEAVDIE